MRNKINSNIMITHPNLLIYAWELSFVYNQNDSRKLEAIVTTFMDYDIIKYFAKKREVEGNMIGTTWWNLGSNQKHE